VTPPLDWESRQRGGPVYYDDEGGKPVRSIRQRLTYANVMSSIAVFLILGGATAIAANQLAKNSVGKKQLKANSVTTAKIKKNAVTTAKLKGKSVTTAKLKDGAVTNPKLGPGAVNFANIAAGTSLVASASGGPVAVNTASPTLTPIPLNGTTSFTPTAGVMNQLNIEARGNLIRSGTTSCSVSVIPYVNGKAFMVSSGFLVLSSDSNTPSETNPIPIDSEAGPVGLGQPGVAQQVSVKVSNNPACTANSEVSVSIAVTQVK
jgi:hypothetical protein